MNSTGLARQHTSLLFRSSTAVNVVDATVALKHGNAAIALPQPRPQHAMVLQTGRAAGMRADGPGDEGCRHTGAGG